MRMLRRRRQRTVLRRALQCGNLGLEVCQRTVMTSMPSIASASSANNNRIIDYASGVCRAMTSSVIRFRDIHEMALILRCSGRSFSPGHAAGGGMVAVRGGLCLHGDEHERQDPAE